MANYEKQVEQEAAYPIPISLYNCYRTVRHEKRYASLLMPHCPVTVVQKIYSRTFNMEFPVEIPIPVTESILSMLQQTFISAHTFSTDDRLLTHRLCCVMLRHVQPPLFPDRLFRAWAGRSGHETITKHGSTWYIGMAHVPRHRFHTFGKSHFHFHFQSEPSFVTTTK